MRSIRKLVHGVDRPLFQRSLTPFFLAPMRFRSTLARQGIFLFGARLSLVIVTTSGTREGSKRLSLQDFIPTTSIGIVESKFPKLGYPRSNNTTADQ